MQTDNEEPTVTYSLRELLADIKSAQSTGFAELKSALESKASREDLAKIEGRLESHARRLDSVESALREDEIEEEVHRRHQNRGLTRRQKIVGAVWSVIGLVVIASATVIGPNWHSIFG